MNLSIYIVGITVLSSSTDVVIVVVSMWLSMMHTIYITETGNMVPMLP
jgi:hypothetical protein